MFCVQLLELAKLSDDANPDVTRVLFTVHDMKARQYVKKLMTDADLEIRCSSTCSDAAPCSAPLLCSAALPSEHVRTCHLLHHALLTPCYDTCNLHV